MNILELQNVISEIKSTSDTDITTDWLGTNITFVNLKTDQKKMFRLKHTEGEKEQ